MLLRRLMQHVRDQNWFAVGLDFVIVVVGVFMAFQVANWADARSERAMEARYLAEIAEDLRDDLILLESVRNTATYRVAGARHILQTAQETVPDADFVLAEYAFSLPDLPRVEESDERNLLVWANTTRIFISNRAGINSLISSGHLRLIRDRDLARQIQQYYAWQEYMTADVNIFRSFRNEGVTAGYRHGLSLFDTRPLDELAALAASDDAFAAYLRTQAELGMVQAGVMDEITSDARALLDRLEQYLEQAA